jgi:acyl-CoA synthetase (AMP-forming)/AMP-acid ligase II
VAFLDVNSEALPLALFGAAWAGVPFVPINYRLTEGEIAALLERVSPALLVTADDRVGALRGHAGATPVGRSELVDSALRPSGAPADPAGDWPMDPDAIAVLLFTSGTTGVPKAAVLRHRHLVSYVLGSVEYASAAPGDAALVSVPPYHVASVAALLSSLYAGRRIVQLSGFDASEWIDLAAREHVTNAFVVPTMLARITAELDSRGEDAPASLRALAYGGGKMPLPVIERALGRFPNVAFTNAYGLTETSSTIALLGPDDHRAAAASEDPAIRRRLGSAGRPLPGVEIELRDEQGRPLPTGQRGEIHVRGEQVSGEYLGRASALLEGGWFATRDGGWLDEDGFLFVEGRIDDVIVRGGENLSPGEIEDVLHEHPAVADCAVVGIPNEQWGEGVAAAIVLAPGSAADEASLREHVEQHLRSSRVPERIAFVDELPYNETGKLLRRVVRQWLAGGAG